MAEYESVKRGKLVIKGRPLFGSGKKRKRKSEKSGEGPGEGSTASDDRDSHGGWWKISSYEELTGAICIEFNDGMYVRALDNGLFTLGAPHNDGEGPAPEEILTCFPTTSNKIALKSGYGKYLSVDKNGIVIGRSDAVGAVEQWEPVFQDGKLALQASNECFLSVEPEEDNVVAQKKVAGATELINIRSSGEREKDPHADIPVEERGKMSQVEENYVRKFQKFQDKKIKICKESKEELLKAKQDGTLHEALLDRRSKMKADRYCK